MAETQIEIYVVDTNDEVIDAVAALLACDDEAESGTLAASIPGAAVSGPVPDPEFIPEEVALFKGYLRADYMSGSDGEESAAALTRFLSEVVPTGTVHTWGHEDGMWEFWYRGAQGNVARNEDEPDSDSHKTLLETTYPWWHEGMPPGVKTGLLAKKFKHPGRKPARRKSSASSAEAAGKSYKRLYEAWQARDYDYLESKLTKRNLYSKQLYDTNAEIPIQFALRKGDERFLEIILNKGYDPEHPVGSDDWTVIHWICNLFGSNLRTAVPFIPRLLDAGVDINGCTNSGRTALFHACSEGSIAAVEILCKAGIDPSMQDRNGETALFQLSQARDSEEAADVVERLAEAGANLSHTNKKGETALFELARKKMVLPMRRLIDLGCDVNHQDNEGNTALHRCRFGLKAARLLVEHGADPNIVNNKGRRADGEASLAEREGERPRQ